MAAVAAELPEAVRTTLSEFTARRSGRVPTICSPLCCSIRLPGAPAADLGRHVVVVRHRVDPNVPALEGAGRIGLAMAAAGFRAKGVENCALGCAALPEGVI